MGDGVGGTASTLHAGRDGGQTGPAPVGPSQVVVEELTGISPPTARQPPRLPTSARAWPAQLSAYLVTVAALVTLAFLLPRALPGNPLDALFDASSATYVNDDAIRLQQAAYYGLDKPLVEQYRRYLGALVRGDLGTSIRYTMPVSDLIQERLPWTLLLIGTAVALAVAVGVVAGIHTGWRRAEAGDRGLLVAFLTLRSFPVFFLASLAAFLFSARLGWFPLSGVSTPFADFGPVTRVLDVAHHLALPMLLLATHFAAGYYLLMRAGMVSQLGADYLVMGRAKGLTEGRLKYAYAARNALLPVMTLTAVQMAAAVTGAIFVEKVFAYRGLGLLLVEGVSARDYPVLQACFLVLSIVVVTVNLVSDLLYARIDPRTKE